MSARSHSPARKGARGSELVVRARSPGRVVAKLEDDQSPKYTRLHEKEDLANLNNRLACYIDRVRTLEAENSRLATELRLTQENVTGEVKAVKGLYESELADARRLLDELSREKAKIQIDTQRIFTENQELAAAIEKQESLAAELRVELNGAEASLAEAANRYNKIHSENKKLSDKNADLQCQVKKLSEDLHQTKKQLEEEILKRVDAENSLQTLKEEFHFREHLLKQQLLDTQSKIDIRRSEIDVELNREYEERLCQSLQEIRDQYEADLEQNKNEIKSMYEEKLKSLESQLSRSNNVTKMAMDELQSVRGKLESLNRIVRELEDERNAAVNNAREAEKRLDAVKSQYLNDYRSHEAEIKKMRDQMAQQIKDYEELMDVKTTLDMEISAFRKLLECEEARLNITPPADNSRRILKGKRRHEDSGSESSFLFNSSSLSYVAVAKVSHEGKYIKLCNNTNDVISIGHWQLIQKVEGQSVVYKFARNVKIKGGSELTVWSADAESVPECAGHIQMKDQRWIAAEAMVITLRNEKNEEVATADRAQAKTLAHKLRVVGHTNRPSSAGSTSFSEEKCSVM